MPPASSFAQWRGAIAADILARLRARAPRVHCITNAVAQNFTANVLLAAGCVPSMTLSPEEIGAFVARAVRCWSISAPSMRSAARRRRSRWEGDAGTTPWVLDPVFVDRAPPRTAFARELWRGPAAVRLNRAEFSALAAAR